MKAVFDTRGASTHQLKMLAEWTRSICSSGKYEPFDVVRFLEIDLQGIFPDLGVFIEPDHAMREARAFISDRPLGVVISESIYEGACSGDLFSTEIILHEIGHLFLHHRYSPLRMNSAQTPGNRIKGMGLANSAEWQANTFAICFLYPFPSNPAERDADFIRIRHQATKRQAERVAQHFKRLATRERSQDVSRDRKWLKEIIDSLPKCRGRPDSLPLGHQLSFSINRKPSYSTACPPQWQTSQS